MTEVKWTRGPWRLDDHQCGKTIIVGPAVNAIRDGVEGEWEIAEIDTHFAEPRSDQENEANAQLMSAAPELYEALANIENDDGRIPNSIWSMRNKALAKARGEQS